LGLYGVASISFLEGLFFNLLLASSIETTHSPHFSASFSVPDKGKYSKHLFLTNLIKFGSNISLPLPLTLQRILTSLVNKDRTRFAAKLRREILLVNMPVKSGIEIGSSTNETSVSILLGTSDSSTSDGKIEGETVGVEGGEQAVVISVACVAVDINACEAVTCVMGIVICEAGVATGTNARAIVLHCGM